MLMYGNFNNIVIDSNTTVYNLTSMREGFERKSYLVPPNEIGRFSGRDFDLAYANYLLNNDIIFKEFFDIVYLLYTGRDVYIIIDEAEWSENLVESLMKLIQQRYGYNSIRINCPEDYFYASSIVTDFNQYYGIHNFDIDKERYTYIIEKVRIANGGPVIYEG